MTEDLPQQLARVTSERDRAIAGLQEAVQALKRSQGPPPWYSARWWLTLICAAVFAVVSVMRILPGEAMVSVLSSVFAFYFLRPDRKSQP